MKKKIAFLLAPSLVLIGLWLQPESLPQYSQGSCSHTGIDFDHCQELVVGFGRADAEGEKGVNVFNDLATQFDLLLPTGSQKIKIDTVGFCHNASDLNTTRGQTSLNFYRVTNTGSERLEAKNNGGSCSESQTWQIPSTKRGVTVSAFNGSTVVRYNRYYLEFGATHTTGNDLRTSNQAYYNRFRLETVKGLNSSNTSLGRGLVFQRSSSWDFNGTRKNCAPYDYKKSTSNRTHWSNPDDKSIQCPGTLDQFNQDHQHFSHNNGFGLAAANTDSSKYETDFSNATDVGSTKEFIFAAPCKNLGQGLINKYVGLYDHDWRSDSSGAKLKSGLTTQAGYSSNLAPSFELFSTSRPLAASPAWQSEGTTSFSSQHNNLDVGIAQGSWFIHRSGVALETTGWDFKAVSLSPDKIYKIQFNNIHGNSHIQVGLPYNYSGLDAVLECTKFQMKLDFSCQGLRLIELTTTKRQVSQVRLRWGQPGQEATSLQTKKDQSLTTSPVTLLDYRTAQALTKKYPVYVTAWKLQGQSSFTQLSKPIQVAGQMTHTGGQKTVINQGASFQINTDDSSSPVSSNHCLVLEIELGSDCSLKITKLQLLSRTAAEAEYIKLDWGNKTLNTEFGQNVTDLKYEAKESYSSNPVLVTGSDYQALYKKLTSPGRLLNSVKYVGRYAQGSTTLVPPTINGQSTKLAIKVTKAKDSSGQSYTSFSSLPPTLPNCGALPVEVVGGCNVIAYNRTADSIKVKLTNTNGLVSPDPVEQLAANGHKVIVTTKYLKDNNKTNSDKTKTKDYDVTIEYTIDTTGANPTFKTVETKKITIGSYNDCCYDTCEAVKSQTNYKSAIRTGGSGGDTTPDSSYPSLTNKPSPVTGTKTNPQKYYTGTRYPNSTDPTISLTNPALVECGNPDSFFRITGQSFVTVLTLNIVDSQKIPGPAGATISYSLEITENGTADPTGDNANTSIINGGKSVKEDDLVAVERGQIRSYGWKDVVWKVTATQTYAFTEQKVWMEGGTEKNDTESKTFTKESTMTGTISCCTRVLIAKPPTCVVRHQVAFVSQETIALDSTTAPVWPVGVSSSRSQIVFNNDNPFTLNPILQYQTVRRNEKNGLSSWPSGYNLSTKETVSPSRSLGAHGAQTVVNEPASSINLPGFYETTWGNNNSRVPWESDAASLGWNGTEASSSVACTDNTLKVYISAAPPTCKLRFYHFEVFSDQSKYEVVISNPNAVSMKLSSVEYGDLSKTKARANTAITLDSTNNSIAANGSITFETPKKMYKEPGQFYYNWDIKASIGIERWSTNKDDTNNKALFEGASSESIHRKTGSPSEFGCAIDNARVVYKPYFKAYYSGISAGGRFGGGQEADSCDGGDNLLGYNRGDRVTGQIAGHVSGTGSNLKGASSEYVVSSISGQDSIYGVYSGALLTPPGNRQRTNYGGIYGRCLPNLWRGYRFASDQQPARISSLRLQGTTATQDGKPIHDNIRYGVEPQSGLLEITKRNTDNRDFKATVYVDGDVRIASDIINNEQIKWSSPSDIGIIYIIAKGDIFIDSQVERIDAVLVALPEKKDNPQKGRIFTCHYENYPQYKGSTHWSLCKKQLVVNGALIASQVRLGRVYGTVGLAAANEQSQLKPTYCYENEPGSLCAAEVINLLPEYYVGVPELPTIVNQHQATNNRTYLPISY